MLQCILFTRAKPSSLGTSHQAAFPYTNGFSNRNKQGCKVKAVFLCEGPWNASKCFSPYSTGPGRQTGGTEVCHGFAAPFLSLSTLEIVEVSIGVGNSSVLAVREIHAFF